MKKYNDMKRKVFIAVMSLVVSGGLSGQSVYPGQHSGKLKKETIAPMQVKSFDLKDVRLLPSRFRENMMRDSMWMASIEVDRLLHSFRTNAGVFAGREGGYMTVKKLGGWESLDCELRGHTTGHLLSAYGLMYAATGSELFKHKGDSLVSGLAEVQNALGNGYLSAYPEELINRNIRGTGVCVVKSDEERITSSASEKESFLWFTRSRMRSMPMNAACPSLQWNTSCLMPSARSARIPPIPSRISCLRRFSQSPP